MARLPILAFLLLLTVSGCTQINNTYTITGNDNVIRAQDSVVTDKKNDDLIDLAGSAYGDANMKGDNK